MYTSDQSVSIIACTFVQVRSLQLHEVLKLTLLAGCILMHNFSCVIYTFIVVLLDYHTWSLKLKVIIIKLEMQNSVSVTFTEILTSIFQQGVEEASYTDA